MVLRGELDLAGGFETASGLLGHLDLRFIVPTAVRAAVVPSVEADRRLQNQENVVTGFLDLADRLRDPVGLGKGIVDRVSQLLHQVLQWLFHRIAPS